MRGGFLQISLIVVVLVLVVDLLVGSGGRVLLVLPREISSLIGGSKRV
jgi:hypothetical protein